MENNIFTTNQTEKIIARIDQLTPNSQALWGKMSVGQMFAHCNVSYEMVYDTIHPKPNAFLKFILKTFVKKKVVGPSPYPKNGQTAPQFLIKETKDFDAEKKRLIDFLTKTQELGEDHFDGKASHSFGVLNKEEWNTLFFKHLDHHLKQFNV